MEPLTGQMLTTALQAAIEFAVMRGIGIGAKAGSSLIRAEALRAVAVQMAQQEQWEEARGIEDCDSAVRSL